MKAALGSVYTCEQFFHKKIFRFGEIFKLDY